MEVTKAKKLLGIMGKVNKNEATTITTSLIFEFTSLDPKALDNLNAQRFVNLGNSLVVITSSCSVKAAALSAHAKQSLKAQTAKVHKLEEISGGKVDRTEYCHFMLKLDLWGIPKHAKHMDPANYNKQKSQID
eukprot:scaffold17457_cov76-Attheya_sp.AAC.5